MIFSDGIKLHHGQETLPFGTVDDVYHEAGKVINYLNEDGGFVFNSIHNILAEIPPEKIIAMYKGAENACKTS